MMEPIPEASAASPGAATLTMQSQASYASIRSVAQRPRSLPIGPAREHLEFAVQLVGAPPEVEQLVEHIKAVAEQFLYRWKTFPLNLPTPVCGGSGLGASDGGHHPHHGGHTGSGGGGGGGRKMRSLNLSDLFVTPRFDELDAVAMDGSGELKRLSHLQLKTIREQGLHKDIKFGKQKKLSDQQLESIQRTGEFEVASLNFPGQMHRWRLWSLLQKGNQRAHDSWLDDLALAARILIVTAFGRLSGPFFSLAHAGRSLCAGLMRLLDMLFGVPSLLAHNLDYKLREERCRYLVAELVCPSEYGRCLDTLCSYVRRQLRRATTEKFDVDSELAPPVPYRFRTPKGLEIDLRLFSRDLIRRALPILIGILERETRGWFLHFRERLIAELREQKMTDSEIEQQCNEAVMREYLQRVYASILSNGDLASLGDGIPALLVQQAQSVVIMHKAIESTQRKAQRQRIETERLLRNDFRILSRIGPWLRAQLRKDESSTLATMTWSSHEEALRMCTKQNLPQAAYFVARDLAFMREREPVLLKELRCVQTPTRTFQWACSIWSARNWIIRRHFQGQSEIIPTVICQQATSIVTPRSDPSQPVFLVERETVRTTSTRWPLWRLLNMVMRAWCWTWNIMFLLGVCVPWHSRLGVRALFGVRPFMPDLELSQVNGTLFPRKTSVTPTLASRLIELWRGISKSRTYFESQPDTGFIGKGLTRHAHRFWNYAIKGLLGTLAVVFVFPVVCVLTSAASVLLAVAAPLWVPAATVLWHVFMLLVYDVDSPEPGRRLRFFVLFHALLWSIVVQGLLQPVLAVLVASIVCPLLSVVVCVFGSLRYWLRMLWDTCTYHTLIRKYGRVPARDGIAVRRIAGPGMSPEYFFVIKPEQALAAFEAKMELDELQAYQHRSEREIAQPQKDFGQFVEACFGAFSAQLSKGGAYADLERECRELQSALHEKLHKRRQELHTGLSGRVLAKIKLNTMDLKIALQQGAHLLEKFYPVHVLGRLSLSEEEFWETKGLQVNDWAGLAGNLFTDIFSHDFLTPLAETDTKFRLEPHDRLDLSRYTEMVQTASDLMGVNGPDLLGNVYAPRGNIQVHSPYLEIAAFNPRSKMTIGMRKGDKRCDTKAGLTTPRVHAKRLEAAAAAASAGAIESDGHGAAALLKSNTWRPWKRKYNDLTGAEKLVIPLPIPHPAHIAIAVHNRDSEQPIQVDSELCREILRAIEDCQMDAKSANIVSRYRGGAGGGSEGDAGSSVGEKSSSNRGRGRTPSSQNSLDDLSDSSDGSSSGGRTNDDSLAEAAGGTETLPCGLSGTAQMQQHAANTRVRQSPPDSSATTANGSDGSSSGGGGGGSSGAGGGASSFHWTLSNWGSSQTARRRGTTVRVDLASPEDISLDTDSARLSSSAYGTTV